MVEDETREEMGWTLLGRSPWRALRRGVILSVLSLERFTLPAILRKASEVKGRTGKTIVMSR